jgi:hypothetical protein
VLGEFLRSELLEHGHLELSADLLGLALVHGRLVRQTHLE